MCLNWLGYDPTRFVSLFGIFVFINNSNIFRTPPYKDLNIKETRKVYIQLYRPSDEAISDPKTFKYVPSKRKVGMKRARSTYSSSGYSTSGEFSSGELPTVLSTVNAPLDDEIPNVNSADLDMAIEAIKNGDPMQILDNEDINNLFGMQFDSTLHRATGNNSLNDNQRLLKSTISELQNMLKTKPDRSYRKFHVSELIKNKISSKKQK